jgi:hypothetical protein
MRTKLLPLACLAVGLAACGDAPNDLWGSIDESFPLDFDRVDILKQNLDLRIEYIKVLHGGENKVCKITLETDNLSIKAGSDLAGDVFMKRVTVERLTGVGGPFPPVTGGQMHFDEYNFTDKGRIDGDFTVIFKTGRHLFGNFRGDIKIVDTN